MDKKLNIKVKQTTTSDGGITKIIEQFDTLNPLIYKSTAYLERYTKAGKETKVIMDGVDKRGNYIGTTKTTIDKKAISPDSKKQQNDLARFKKEIDKAVSNKYKGLEKEAAQLDKIDSKKFKSHLKNELLGEREVKTRRDIMSVGKESLKYADDESSSIRNQGEQIAKSMAARKGSNAELKRTHRDTDAVDKKFQDAAKSEDKFNMNALGVMFAGMAMQRTFAGLNATAREWVGMNELMSTAMGVTMLPATMELLELGVLPLFDALTTLPEVAQKAIGYTSIALEGLGAVMMTGGQLMLGLESTSKLLAKYTSHNPALALGKITTSLKTLGKVAGTGIAISMVIQDLQEGEMVAAVGSAVAGVGIATGNPWIIGIGLALKLAGDEEAQKSVARMMILIGDRLMAFAEWAAESWAAIWDPDTEVDMTFFHDFANTYKKEMENMAASGELMSDYGKNSFTGMIVNAQDYEAELQKITEKYTEDGPKKEAAMASLNDEYSVYLNFIKESNIALEKNIALWEKLAPSTKSLFGTDSSEMNWYDKQVDTGYGSSSLDGPLTPPAYNTQDKNENIVINQTNNYSGYGMNEVKAEINKSSDKLTADVRKAVKF